MCRCTAYCVLVKTSDYFQKLINLINNCEYVSIAGGHREPGGDAWWPLATYPGATRRGTCVHSWLSITQWQLCQHQSGSFCLYFICSILHSILNSSTFVSYLLSTAQLTMLLWQLDNLCGNQPNIFLILINIWNLFEISNPKQESLIISSYSSSYWKSASSNSFTLDRISQTLIGVCNLTVVAQ